VPISIVLVNASGPEEARQIGRALVESRLAAAVNVVAGIAAIYRWQGAVRERAEAQLIVKTRADLVEAVIERVRALHSYECPGIVAFAVAGGNPDYIAWIETEAVASGEE